MSHTEVSDSLNASVLAQFSCFDNVCVFIRSSVMNSRPKRQGNYALVCEKCLLITFLNLQPFSLSWIFSIQM